MFLSVLDINASIILGHLFTKITAVDSIDTVVVNILFHFKFFNASASAHVGQRYQGATTGCGI